MSDDKARVEKAAQLIADAFGEIFALTGHGPLDDAAMVELCEREGYIAWKRFADGTYAAVGRLLFTYAIYSEVTRIGYGRRWCYHDRIKCLCEFEDWTDVNLAPDGWHKAVHTGERRDENGNSLGVW